MPRRFAPRQFLTISQKVKIGGVFWTKFEHFLRKTPTKEASPATARQARHTTEKYSLLFSFCAPPIFSAFNEKSIFLRCSAFQVFRQVAGLSAIWFWKEKAEFPPNPPSAFSFLKRNGNGSRRAKIPPPNSLPFYSPALASPPKLFGGTAGLWN